jgi:GNAT superfamily N-acetyltransferase
MTALTQYDRLEATGLWRPTPEDQRREVIVSVGDATLTISDLNDRPLAHWSLAAVERMNPGQEPAIYHPDGDPSETLELPLEEADMVAAIERLRQAIDRARPRPGRLRLVMITGMVATLVLLLVFWLPGAMLNHTVRVVPDIQRKAIGQALLGRIERVSGQACASADSTPILQTLAERTNAHRLEVLSNGISQSLYLPGGLIILNRALIEDHEDPAVAAGVILAEQARADLRDPLAELLSYGGPLATFRMLTTGQVSQAMMDHYVEQVLKAPRPAVADQDMLARFAQSAIPSSPYAYAADVTGETVLGLIEADPMSGRIVEPVLSDRDWVLLQNICGG